MNSKKLPANHPPALPTPPTVPAAAPAPAPVAPKGNSQRKASNFSKSTATAEQKAVLQLSAAGGAAGNQPSQQAKAERDEKLAEEAANKRPIGRPKKGCYSLTLWGHSRGISTHKGEVVWQGEDERKEGVGVEEDEGETLEHAEQLTDEHLGQLVRLTRSRTRAARTQAAPSAHTSGAAMIKEAEGVE